MDRGELLATGSLMEGDIQELEVSQVRVLVLVECTALLEAGRVAVLAMHMTVADILVSEEVGELAAEGLGPEALEQVVASMRAGSEPSSLELALGKDGADEVLETQTKVLLVFSGIHNFQRWHGLWELELPLGQLHL